MLKENSLFRETKDNVLNAVQRTIRITIIPVAYRHDMPFYKGGTSLAAANVRILCPKCNLIKSNPPLLNHSGGQVKFYRYRCSSFPKTSAVFAVKILTE